MSRTATQQGPAGLFATSRRGGLTKAEVSLVEELRALDRPWSWQNIARRLGRCEADVRAFFDGEMTEARPVTPKPALSLVPKALPQDRHPLLGQRTGKGRSPFPFTQAHVATIESWRRAEITTLQAMELIGCSNTALKTAARKLAA